MLSRTEQLGAQRFVNYWESRRDLFGPEKFVLPMTLSGALIDDLVAVEACLCRPLPHLDKSGRQLLVWEWSRHTRKGYTSESMVSVAWSFFIMASVLVCEYYCAPLLQCISHN
jgi:hypothetical protein